MNFSRKCSMRSPVSVLIVQPSIRESRFHLQDCPAPRTYDGADDGGRCLLTRPGFRIIARTWRQARSRRHSLSLGSPGVSAVNWQGRQKTDVRETYAGYSCSRWVRTQRRGMGTTECEMFVAFASAPPFPRYETPVCCRVPFPSTRQSTDTAEHRPA